MAVHIEVRDVSEEVYRVLRARAVRHGVSLSTYLRGLLGEAAADGSATAVPTQPGRLDVERADPGRLVTD